MEGGKCQGTAAKSDRKSENPSRKLKEYEGNYRLKPDKGNYSCRQKKKTVLVLTQDIIKDS